MSQNACPTAEQLTAFANDTLRGAELERVVRHLETGCEACRRVLERLGATPHRSLGGLKATDKAPEGTLPYSGESGCARAVDRLAETLPPAPPGGPSHGGGYNAGADPLPRMLGKYQLQKVIGGGGMGTVYEALDTLSLRRVAVKVMRPAPVGQEEARQRFLRDVRIQASFDEKGIVVPILDCGEIDGVFFIVMPLLEGETLADRLKREPKPPVSVVVDIGRQVAQGLKTIHQHRLFHRDLKPSNIWLEGTIPGLGQASGRVRLFDLGMDLTPAYASPEQIDGKVIDARSDLFSLGVVLYEMAVGKAPFQGADVMAVVVQVNTHNPPPPRQINRKIPAHLSTLIDRLLQKKKEERPASAAEVERELARIATYLRVRRLLWPALAAVITLFAAGVGLAQLVNGNRSGATSSSQSSLPAKFTGSVDLMVDRDGSLVALSSQRAMPLHDGDDVIVAAKVTPSAYLYVFWIDEKGKATPLYPWTDWKWGQRSKKGPVDKLAVTDPNGKLIKISGKEPAIETILMLARSTPLEATDAEIQSWFDGLQALPFPGEKSRVYFDDFELVPPSDQLRGPVFGDKDYVASAVKMQERLRDRIGAHATFSSAVSFARKGK